MKLAALLLGMVSVATWATTGTAAADEALRPPGGPVYVSADPSPPPPMRARRDLPPDDLGRGALRGGPRGGVPRAERAERAQQLRRALLETFDVNGDGRLGPRERMRAARVLRRIERRLAADDPRGRAVRGAIRRYDLDGDGNVGPDEMPPAAARRLRRLDRDGDGWVEPGEYR
jgi:hypothetical protein